MGGSGSTEPQWLHHRAEEPQQRAKLVFPESRVSLSACPREAAVEHWPRAPAVVRSKPGIHLMVLQDQDVCVAFLSGNLSY